MVTNERRLYNYLYYDTHSDRERQRARDTYQRLEDELFNILGMGVIKCARCGRKDKRALDIDHKHGGGNADRARFGNQTKNFYRYYIWHPEEAWQNLQLLCVYCNRIKKHENNEMPYA